MPENKRVIESLAQRAAWDPDFLRNLISKPVETVKNVRPRVTDADAQDIADKAIDTSSAIQGPDLVKLFKQLVSNATDVFKKTVFLNQFLFYTGIALLAVTFGFEIAGRVTGNISWQNIATTGIVGAIGIGAVISSFLLRPLDSIQNSVGNLAQIEVGFLSFIERSRKMANSGDPASISDAKQISKELGKAAKESMALIENYCEYRKNKAAKESEQGQPV